MQTNGFRYALMMFKADDTPLGQTPVVVDWEPAEEWTRFLAVRRGVLGPSDKPNASIAPTWSDKRGEPYLTGFRVTVPVAGEPVVCEFPTTYFSALASRASSGFVERGELQEGETFHFEAVAFPITAPQTAPRTFETEEVMPAVRLNETPLRPVIEAATASDEAPAAADMPVLVPRHVLDEAVSLTRDAGARETGGVLIGQLHRDTAAREVFVEVTAQIHARLAEGDAKKLSFTPAVWSDVDGVLQLRKSEELVVGWWHSHPSRVWCAKCPAENQKVCALARGFFSEHDRLLHRTVFPRAYSTALVVNDAVGGVTHSMYGWRHGALELRGFHVTEEIHQVAGLRAGGVTGGCGDDADRSTNRA